MIQPLGDSAALVQLGTEIDPVINKRIHALSDLIEAVEKKGIIETVPAYSTLLVHYDPLILTYTEVNDFVNEQISRVDDYLDRKPRLIEVPVSYGGALGMDLETVAMVKGLSPADVIRIHSQSEYTVYMMGFTPGFPYMGKLESGLVMPRLETPRTLVSAGTVAIAGEQTGIYSLNSPGGWHCIGWTTLKLFDPENDTPFLFMPGDRVRFYPVEST